MPRFVTIGRHEFTSRQKELLAKAGLVEEAAKVMHVDDPARVVELARAEGARAVVVQALPLPLLAKLLAAAGKAGVDVLRFEMETLATVGEGERCPPGTEAELPSPDGKTRRCVRTARLVKVKRVVVETEPVAE